MTSLELWLSQADMFLFFLKGGKEGEVCPVIISSQSGAVIVLNIDILDQITTVCIQLIPDDSQKYISVGSDEIT